MRLPSRGEIRYLRKKYAVSDRVMRGKIDAHTITVRRVALDLGRRLTKSGHSVNLNLIKRAALLHDMTKAEGGDHATSAAVILAKRGYPELARVVGSHDTRVLLKCDWRKLSPEEMLLMYADARSASGYIQSLGERSRMLQQRYPEHRTEIETSFNKLGEFEDWLKKKGVDTSVRLNFLERLRVSLKRRGI